RQPQLALGSAMPLLVLCDPGCAASVGVSKPAGASVADGCPSTGHAPVITANSNTRAEGYVWGSSCSPPEQGPARTTSRTDGMVPGRQVVTSLPRRPAVGWIVPPAVNRSR